MQLKEGKISTFEVNCAFLIPADLAGFGVNPKSLVKIQLLKLWQAVMTFDCFLLRTAQAVSANVSL